MGYFQTVKLLLVLSLWPLITTTHFERENVGLDRKRRYIQLDSLARKNKYLVMFPVTRSIKKLNFFHCRTKLWKALVNKNDEICYLLIV